MTVPRFPQTVDNLGEGNNDVIRSCGQTAQNPTYSGRRPLTVYLYWVATRIPAQMRPRPAPRYMLLVAPGSTPR